LGGGINEDDVYLEVADGGLIAYLIKEHDKEIQRPIARILIRRFSNILGHSLAFAERRVYGGQVGGFLDIVEKWLKDKQANELAIGEYTLRGGKWSDSFDGNKRLTDPNPDGKELKNVPTKNINDFDPFFTQKPKYVPKYLNRQDPDTVDVDTDQLDKFGVEYEDLLKEGEKIKTAFVWDKFGLIPKEQMADKKSKWGQKLNKYTDAVEDFKNRFSGYIKNEFFTKDKVDASLYKRACDEYDQVCFNLNSIVEILTWDIEDFIKYRF
jgi:hypothetical protein